MGIYTMEEHVILRIPPDLRPHFDAELEDTTFVDCEFHLYDPENMFLTYKKQNYKITKIKLPCIMESQKTFDAKQHYKINNISTMFVVWPQNFTEEEIKNKTEIYECSG